VKKYRFIKSNYLTFLKTIKVPAESSRRKIKNGITTLNNIK